MNILCGSDISLTYRDSMFIYSCDCMITYSSMWMILSIMDSYVGASLLKNKPCLSSGCTLTGCIPFATKRALNLSIVPPFLGFTLNTHLVLMALSLICQDINSQVALFWSALNSFFIADFHSGTHA